MTFKKFEEIVKAHRPDVTVHKHNTYAEEKSNFCVFVVFNEGTPNESRVYRYNGSYIDVLNKLHINTVEQKYVDSVKHRLAELEAEHGTEVEGLFGDTYIADNTEEINRYSAMLEDYKNYVVV